ncbi:MAG: hypothetical protein DMC57_03885, partial [Verrucomicrobia bacterium]
MKLWWHACRVHFCGNAFSLQPTRLPLHRVEFISAFQFSGFQLLFSLWRRLTQAWSSARNVGRAKWLPKKNR